MEDCGGGRTEGREHAAASWLFSVAGSGGGIGLLTGKGLSKEATSWWPSAEILKQGKEYGLQCETCSHLNSEMALFCLVTIGSLQIRDVCLTPLRVCKDTIICFKDHPVEVLPTVWDCPGSVGRLPQGTHPYPEREAKFSALT